MPDPLSQDFAVLLRLLPASLLAACVAFAAGTTAIRCAADEPADDHFRAVPDAFQTLVNPNCSHCIDESKRRAKELRDDDRVIAWTRGKYEGGAIPLRFFLVPYRVISDTYGVFVYDPDAGFVRGYEPSLDFTFHGWRNGVMVIRHKDGTLFSALSGKAFAGPRAGEALKPIATIETNWGHWLAAYPGSVAYNMFEKYKPAELPKGDSADSLATRLAPDRRLDANAPVLGVALGDHAAAYPIERLKKLGGVVADRIGDQDVYVLLYAPTGTAAIYANTIDDTSPEQTVTLAYDAGVPAAPFVDKETGSHWGIEGRAVDGPLEGKTLAWLPGVQCRWFAWAAEYPKTRIFGDDAKVGGGKNGGGPQRAVLVAPRDVSDAAADRWARDGANTVVVTLAESVDRSVYEAASRAIAQAGLALYYWIEVGRNPAMAEEHPEWMAALGMHDDWQKRFPNAALPRGKEEVAKAFPWVPIACKPAFDAHLARIAQLLKRAAGDYRGLVLNDLQGGPASCGCGNLQCRWAIDYHVPRTAEQVTGPDVAARFVKAVEELAAGREVIPVWVTECEDGDLPAAQAPGGRTTGYCGTVRCAQTTCPKAFTEQWSALVTSHRGPIGVLALAREFGRQGDAWASDALRYLDDVPSRHGGAKIAHDRLWLVVDEADGAAGAAWPNDVACLLVAKARVDQSYAPRIVKSPLPSEDRRTP
ncbi:MAG: DUF3179 domain-containing protein [Planctomycetia bacterium]|nr:DUF3179 domain-containing protein [Planctomycetia bacterium]